MKQLTDQELIEQARVLKMDFDQLKSWLCINCQECCKWVTVQTYLKDVHAQMEFVKFYVEGRKLIMHKTPRGIHLSIPNTCPHLIPGIGCEIYETRPSGCVLYDGRIDILMKDICKWSLLDEILKEDEE